MGAERRRDPRIRCNFPCVLRVAGRSLDGKVRNVSASGLGVAADASELEQGDSVKVRLRVDGVAIEVHALVWHVRSSGRCVGDKSPRVLGLVLSDTAPDFARLVERLGAKPAQAEPASAPPQPAPPTPVRPLASRPSAQGAIARANSGLKVVCPAPVPTREYRIRIKQSGGPRTCQIVASGASKEAAAEAALAEVGPGWMVLEAVLIP